MGVVRFERNGPGLSGLPPVEPHPPEVLDGPEPAQYRRLYLNEPRWGLRAGIWGCTPFATKLVTQKSHEVAIVVDGEVIIEDEGGRQFTYAPGQAFILQGGLKRRWIHRMDSTVYFMSHEGVPSTDARSPILIDPDAELAPTPPPAAAMLLGPTPDTRGKAFHEDPTKAFAAGVWQATPYHRRTTPFPRYELMHLLEGEVSFTSEDGTRQTFQKGDTFLHPKDVVADWNSPVTVRKIYGVFRPPA